MVGQSVSFMLQLKTCTAAKLNPSKTREGFKPLQQYQDIYIYNTCGPLPLWIIKWRTLQIKIIQKCDHYGCIQQPSDFMVTAHCLVLLHAEWDTSQHLQAPSSDNQILSTTTTTTYSLLPVFKRTLCLRELCQGHLRAALI